ncbi:TetR/AcrR family transcriptional regulator [Oerskovia sp. Root22]|uniref:TetR/AcrR family transcriptional regulator n=1 Tax=Oerskovia sp. Root22 TaxID=1736494 RepID=UPI000700AE5D|nr:TetR/AcrR family transcriptional regulator [Oerskovia sp. Root22]KRC35653.1 hypothetical protein ASE15_11105 [Oerskovia sp. Root22]
MPTTDTPLGRAANLGPAAAARNRTALLAAARAVFAESGIEAPLAAIARRAGVGQGSLYRHFPDRVALAVAVFEDNVAELELLAADPRSTLRDLLTTVTQQIVDSTAFVDLVRAANTDRRVASLATRVEAVIDARVRYGHADGTVPGDRTASDLMLSVTMVSAAVSSDAPATTRLRLALRAWRLLGVDLSEH